MAMTLEEKITKKAKPFSVNNLKFKNGLAIVLEEIEETATEYDSHCSNRVKLYFKSKAAIKRAADVLGYRLDKKQMTEAFERGQTYTRLSVTFTDIHFLKGAVNLNKSLKFDYRNHYTSQRYFVVLDPTIKVLPEEHLKSRTGSTADGEPLSDYFKGLKESIIKGDYTYLR